MADKNVQIKFNNGGSVDNIFPVTKMELVEGLPAALAATNEQLAETTKQVKDINLNVRDYGAKGDWDGITGTDDTIAIQAAIDAAFSIGGTVIIPPSIGEYIFTTIHVKSNVTLKSTGGVLRLKDNTCNTSSTSYYLINNLGETNVIYDGLIVDGNQINNSQFVVADLITCVGLNSKIINCDLYNAPDSGIMFSSAENGLCQNNRIKNCRDLGIYINALGASIIDGAIISKNIIAQCTFGGIGLKRETKNVIVSDNTISYCGNGITIEDFTSIGQGYPTNIQIVNNSIRNIGYPYRGTPSVAEIGISVSKTKNATISNNKIVNCSGKCIGLTSITDSTIENNTAEGYPTNPGIDNAGIHISANVTNIILTGNIVKNVVNRGCYITDVSNSIITNNVFYSTTTFALRVDANCFNNIIRNNTLKGGAGADSELYDFKSIFEGNISLSSTGAALSGVRTLSAGQQAPNTGSLAPHYAGEQLVYLLDSSWWIAGSIAGGDWKKISP